MDKIIISIVGFIGILGTAWFFFGKKDKAVESKNISAGKQEVDIEVKGGYNPAKIIVPRGKETILSFKRTDDSSCLEEVVLSDFKIRKFLPLNEKVAIAIKPEKSGEYDISCGMNMFHGKIIVK